MEKALQINVLKFIVAFGAVIASQIPVECHVQNSFEIEAFNCTFDASYFNQSNSECVLKSLDGRNKFVGGHGELTKAIDELVGDLTVYLESSPEEGHSLLLFNVTHSVCSFADGIKSSPIGAAIHQLWKRYTNLPVTCPVEPGVYYVKDVDYNDVAAQNIPIVLPSGRYKINVKAHHKNEFVLSASVLLTVKMDKKSTN